MKRAWLEALHQQWLAARGRRSAPSQRPFYRKWETLLTSANLHSAEDRKIALREAEAEEARGHLRLHRLRGRRHIVTKIEVPLPAEGWLVRSFGRRPPVECHSESLEAVARAEERTHPRFPRLWRQWCQTLHATFTAGKSQRPLDWRSPEMVQNLLDIVFRLTSLEYREGALVREISIEIGLSSKDLERRRRSIEASLRQMFGRPMPLQSLGIVLSDSRADLGGVLTIHYPGGETQVLDQLKEIYTLSLGDLERASHATTPAARLLTVENSKTTLRRLVSVNVDSSTLLAACSFPTKALIRLLELLPEDMPVYHFGDTDPAGYHILAKLREATGHTVHAFLMKHRSGDAPLTEYDLGLLPRLLDDPNLSDVNAEIAAISTSGRKGDYEQETLGTPDLDRWPFFSRASI